MNHRLWSIRLNLVNIGLGLNQTSSVHQNYITRSLTKAGFWYIDPFRPLLAYKNSYRCSLDLSGSGLLGVQFWFFPNAVFRDVRSLLGNSRNSVDFSNFRRGSFSMAWGPCLRQFVH